MCKFKSGIILKDRVFVPDHDHHTQMLEELGIEDTSRNAETLFVRFELRPLGDDTFSDIDTWEFKVDQDIIPEEWFVKDYEKGRAREAVKLWAKEHINIDKDGLELREGTHYIKDCKNVVLRGGSTVDTMFGSSTVNMMYGRSTVNKMYGSSTVNEMYGKSTVNEMYGGSAVNKMYGKSTAITHALHDIGKPKALILSDNSTFKDNKNKVIYQSGDWQLVSVK